MNYEKRRRIKELWDKPKYRDPVFRL